MKAYTYNDRLVGVGNDQILGTDQGGGSTYTAGNGIDITNDVISVDDTVALVSALPTTELGKFTIQSNVSGGPIEVIVPTDVAPVSAFYDLNVQYDDTLSNRTGPSTYYYVFKSPGYDNDTWSANDGDVIQIKVNEAIQGIGSIMGFYASNSSPASSSAPPINYPVSNPLITGTGVTYAVQPGIYTTGLGANPAGSNYGKYITLMINTGGSGLYVDDILDKIEFTIGRPNAALGTTVNLSRYYLGNTVSTSTPASDLACYVTVDDTTKQQKVYLPSSMPSNWTSRVAQYVQYGSNRFSPGYYSTSQQYIAYKQSSSPTRYQYAFCTHHDSTNRTMTFISYNESGQAIEKWIVDYSNYSSNVWTTTAITPDMSDYATEVELQAVSGALDNYIPYSASGVYLPNSKFEIDANGQAYKVISTSTETSYGSWNGDGCFGYGNYYTLPTRNADGTGTLKAGTYRFTLPNKMNSIKVIISGNTAAAYSGMVIPATNHVADLIITKDLTFIPQSQGNDYILIQGWTHSDGTGTTYPGLWSDNSSAVYISPDVKEEYLINGDLELNDNNQVTAIDGHALAGNGGTTYTAGNGIDITNDVISVDNTVALASAIPDISGLATKTELQDGLELVTGLIPDTSDMATKTWVGNQGYLTSVPEGYATDIEVSQAIASSIVQSDWAVTAVDSPAYIENKPETLEMEISPVSGGNCISITEGNAGSIDWITTAGITDIISVTALPANPVATVIYLIPET